MNSVAYSYSDTFSSINNISISVERSIFTLVFFKATCHANPETEKNLQDQVHLFQNT